MINRNQGKAGFSVSGFSFFFFLQIAVDQFVFFCFNVPCIPTENKTGVPCLFLFISTNEYFLSPMHMKNGMNYTYVVVLLLSLYIIDNFLN